MKVKVKEAAKCQKKLEIEVPKEVVEEAFVSYYNQLKKTAQIPGFRKGKVPPELLKEHFSDKANEKVLTNLVNDAYHQAIEKENIHPVTMPEVSNVNFKNDEKLTFEATVDIRPKFNLKDYKNIKIKKEKLQVKDEDVNKVLGYLRERYAQFSPIEDRGVKNEDYIICDYSYEVQGKQIEKKDHAWLAITNDMFIPGLSKKIEGIKPGEGKNFDITFPEKFHLGELAKKTAQFQIQVKEIKEKKLPELNDEFAKMLGKNSLEELKLQINDDLTKEKEMHIKQEMKEQLIAHLVKSMPIDVPQALVDKREQALKDTAKQRLKQHGMNEEQIQAEEKKMTDLFKTEAIKQVRTFFILEDIAKKENIKVEAQEMEERIETIARSYNQKKEELLKYLQDNNLLENIHWDLWEEKIIAFLITNANIEETSKK